MLKLEPLTKAIGQDRKMYASFVQRLAARLVDLAMLFCLLYLFSYLYKPLLEEGETVGFLIFYLLYYPIMEKSGGTIGKRIVGVRTVNLPEELTLDLESVIMRTFFQAGPLIPLVFIKDLDIHHLGIQLLLGVCIFFPYLVSIWAPKRQAWHDILSSTVVIKL